MTRGCTEAWEAHPERATWLALSALPNGALVEFVEDYDIFPDGVVKAGTRANVGEQGLNEANPILKLDPVDPIAFLHNWDGQIWLMPRAGRLEYMDSSAADEFDPAPVKIINTDDGY